VFPFTEKWLFASICCVHTRNLTKKPNRCVSGPFFSPNPQQYQSACEGFVLVSQRETIRGVDVGQHSIPQSEPSRCCPAILRPPRPAPFDSLEMSREHPGCSQKKAAAGDTIKMSFSYCDTSRLVRPRLLVHQPFESCSTCRRQNVLNTSCLVL
jgi:hypothetical protein